MESKNPCEYNPEENRAAYENEVHAKAEYIVGYNGLWRLCGNCAALPKFSRFTVKKKISNSE